MRTQPVDLADVMTRAAEAMQPLADRAHVVMRVTPLAARISGDREGLTRAVTNLLHNAVSVSPVGGTVSVDAQQIASSVLIWVRDEGPGIPAGDIEVIFHEAPGSTGPDENGLAVVRGIIEQHGGSVWAESMPPAGTTFLVQLPCV
jgi:signal transduction histidine kinase